MAMSNDDKKNWVIISHVLLYISFQIFGWMVWLKKENDTLSVIAIVLLSSSVLGIIALTAGNPGDQRPKQHGESWNQAAGRQGRGGWGAGNTIMINFFLSISLVMVLTLNITGMFVFLGLAYGIYSSIET